MRLALPWMRVTTAATVCTVLALPGTFATASATDAKILLVRASRDDANSNKTLNGNNSIAVNPKNPNNLVYVATNHDTFVFADGDVSHVEGYHCWGGRSMDGGRTWTAIKPFPTDGDRPQCGIPTVSVASDGTFYVTANQLGNPKPIPDNTATKAVVDTGANHVGVSSSTDGGKTWSAPVAVNLSAEGHPKSRVDAATGKVYALSSRVWWGNTANCVVVSSDKGKTWTQIASAFPGGHMAVYGGLFATASVDSNTSTLVFHLSHDDGTSYTDLMVTDGQGKPVVGGSSDDGGPYISADPTKKGRFAVMQYAGGNFRVYVTDDAGAHWNGPALVPARDYNSTLPWFDYGSGGALALTWRDYTGSNQSKLDSWAAVSLNHGSRFSKPLRLTPKTQPAGEYHSMTHGDDYSWITSDSRYAYVGWPDGRDGQLAFPDAIFAKVPFGAFQFH